jgi:SMC interacting uncharacterized protein involved in chromosome segregation
MTWEDESHLKLNDEKKKLISLEADIETLRLRLLVYTSEINQKLALIDQTLLEAERKINGLRRSQQG